jgi:hypothetical protein
MPSPIGHALGALTVGWAVSGRAPSSTFLTRSLWVAAFGIAPDLDLLIGRHSMETHSIGAAVCAGAAAAAFRLPLASTRWRTFLVACLAWMTHPLLDALGDDTAPPLGVMLWWPLSREHELFARIFMPISRRWWHESFWTGNLLAALWEIALLAPVAFAAWWFMQRPSALPGAGRGKPPAQL